MAERQALRLDLPSVIRSYQEAALIGISGQQCDDYYPCDLRWNHLLHVPNDY